MAPAPQLTEAQVRARLASAIVAKGGVAKFAHHAGVSDTFVYKALKDGTFGPKLLKALGLTKATTTYFYEGPPVRPPNGTRAKP